MTTQPAEAPVCKFEEGCHRVAVCAPGCGTPSQPTARQRLIDAMRARTCFCGADSCQNAEEYVDAFARELAAAAASGPTADRAASAAWSEDDPLMWAIARAVWEHCSHDDKDMPQLVLDDPRTIAAAAAGAARTVLGKQLRDASGSYGSPRYDYELGPGLGRAADLIDPEPQQDEVSP